MYAVVATGGKQYRLSVGDLVDVEKLDVPVGQEVVLSEVLLVADEDGSVRIGQPTVPNVVVRCRVVAQDKNKKIIVYKYRRRKGVPPEVGPSPTVHAAEGGGDRSRRVGGFGHGAQEGSG